ncbi:MAG: PKD domain-containing protein [Flavobacteriales bacterium]
MKKLFTAFLLVCLGSQINAQTTVENCDGFASAPDAYTSGSFTGVNGISWDYTASRNNSSFSIDGTSIMLRRISDSSRVEAMNIPGGVSSISMKLKKGFTGGGDRKVEVFVNGASVGMSTAFDDTLVHTYEITGLTDTGNFDLKILNVTPKQVVIDDITWTGNGVVSTTPTMAFSNSADTIFVDAFAADLPYNQNFDFNYTNFVHGVDGLVQYAYIDAASTLTFDTNSTGSLSLDLAAFGTHTVAVGFTTLAGVPNTALANDTIVVVLNEKTITEVATIAELRAGTQGELYKLTGEAVISHLQNFRNQKFIQDATAGILIDDNDDVITGTFNMYDGMMNITGELTSHNGLMQFKPTEDVTTASSTGNTITPEVVTLADFIANIDNYESELIQIQNVTVTSADTNIFLNGKNHDMTNGTETGVFRTNFYNVDYIGTEIPGESHYTGIAIRYNSTPQLASRMLTDICALDYNVAAIVADENLDTVNYANYSVGFTAPSGYTGYSWDFGDGSAVSTDMNPTHDFTANGTYTVKLTVTNHCGIDKTVEKDIIVASVGIEEAIEFSMFPVPAENVLNLNFVNDNAKTIAIFNAIGVNVGNYAASNSIMINTSALTSGVYVIVVEENNAKSIKRFVVK